MNWDGEQARKIFLLGKAVAQATSTNKILAAMSLGGASRKQHQRHQRVEQTKDERALTSVAS
jgi:hypothetical protein